MPVNLLLVGVVFNCAHHDIELSFSTVVMISQVTRVEMSSRQGGKRRRASLILPGVLEPPVISAAPSVKHALVPLAIPWFLPVPLSLIILTMIMATRGMSNGPTVQTPGLGCFLPQVCWNQFYR